MSPYDPPKYEQGPDTSNVVELIMSIICLVIYLFLFFLSAYHHNAVMAVLTCLLSAFFAVLTLANLTRRYFR